MARPTLEKEREYARRYRERHPQWWQKRCQHLKENRKERDALYRQRHPDRIRASRNKFRASEKGRAYNEKTRKLRTEQEKQRYRRLRERQPDKWQAMVRNMSAIRRTRKGGSSRNLKAVDLPILMRNQRGRCWWCGDKLNTEYHVDHREPLSRGGAHELGNLVLSCARCNLAKGKKTPQEFAGRLL